MLSQKCWPFQVGPEKKSSSARLMIGSIMRIAESIIMKIKRTIVIVSLVMIRMMCFEYENYENGDSD